MATIEEIYDDWLEDSKINRAELGWAASDIPKLHHKYMKKLSHERLILRKQETDHDILTNNKRSWMDGTMSKQELDDLHWSVHLKKLTKGEIEVALKSDPDMVKNVLKLALQREKVEALDSIVKMIFNRSFQLNAAIQYEKFKAGVG